MIAGNLDERILIETITDGVDSVGTPTKSWGTLATVWADVQPETGTESLTSDRELTERRSRFYIRHRTDVTVKDRIVYDSLNWDIVAMRVVDKDKRKDGLEIVAKVIQ